MYPFVTKVGEGGKKLVEFYDLDCPFCAQVGVKTWPQLLNSGKPFELVYFPVHYMIWENMNRPDIAIGSLTANLLPYCIDANRRVEVMVELFDIYLKTGDEPAAISKQVGRLRELVDADKCRERFHWAFKRPQLVADMAQEYALSFGHMVTGVPTAFLIDGGRLAKVAQGLKPTEDLLTAYLAEP